MIAFNTQNPLSITTRLSVSYNDLVNLRHSPTVFPFSLYSFAGRCKGVSFPLYKFHGENNARLGTTNRMIFVAERPWLPRNNHET